MRLILPIIILILTSRTFASVERYTDEMKISDFNSFDPRYSIEILALRAELKELQAKVFEQESQGHNTVCAGQILQETYWLQANTAHLETIRKNLQELRTQLNVPYELRKMDSQSKEDGSWGICYKTWFFKLTASYDKIGSLHAEGRSPEIPVTFLDQVNGPEKFRSYIKSLVVADISKTGMNTRRELNESLSNLMRLILRQRPLNYSWHPEMRKTVLEVIEEIRDEESRFWVGRYLHKGKVYKTLDMSITFHVIAYLKGKISDWPQVIDTTLRIKNLTFPQGWRSSSAAGYSNHHNMDVASIFSFGWEHANEEQKDHIRSGMRILLDWCLKNSFKQDGSFVLTQEDDSVETAYYFGTAFLIRIGYFHPERRFWTDVEFPEAKTHKELLLKKLYSLSSSGADGGSYRESAIQELLGN